MIQFLLSKGANPNLHDYFDGQSPITLAAGYYGEDIKMLKLLLEYGGDPNDHTLDSDSVTDMRSMSTPLINAATNDLEKVKLLIKAGADINLAVESGQPPLFRAIMNNRADVIRYLVIDQKADFRQVFIVTIQGDTLDFKDLLSGSAMEMVEESAKELSCVYDYLKQFE